MTRHEKKSFGPGIHFAWKSAVVQIFFPADKMRASRVRETGAKHGYYLTNKQLTQFPGRILEESHKAFSKTVSLRFEQTKPYYNSLLND